jgi:hypothetical protein
VSSVPIPRIRKSSFPKAGIGLPPCCSFWRLQVATILNREEIRNDDRMILFFHGGMQPRTGLRIRLDSLAMEFGPQVLQIRLTLLLTFFSGRRSSHRN